MTNQRAIILLSQMYLPAFDEEEKDAITKAIEALTAQEPRVMTAKDFIDNPNADSEGFLPAWIEYRRDGEWLEYWDGTDDEWSLVTADNYKSEGYRCWTSRPSKEEMEAAPWN